MQYRTVHGRKKVYDLPSTHNEKYEVAFTADICINRWIVFICLRAYCTYLVWLLYASSKALIASCCSWLVEARGDCNLQSLLAENVVKCVGYGDGSKIGDSESSTGNCVKPKSLATCKQTNRPMIFVEREIYSWTLRQNQIFYSWNKTFFSPPNKNQTWKYEYISLQKYFSFSILYHPEMLKFKRQGVPE